MADNDRVDEPCGVTDDFLGLDRRAAAVAEIASIVANVRAWLLSAQRTILVHADDEQRWREALADAGIRPDDPLWKVQVNVFIEPGKAVIIPAELTKMEVDF